jgi:PilZ domain-containing protein
MDFSEEPGGQRRRHTRRSVQLAARIKFARSEVAAIAENISPGGAFLRVTLPDGAEWLVADIDLPEGKTVSVKAHVRWRRQDPPGVGVQFHSFLERWG